MPPAPEQVRVEGRTDVSIMVTWDPPSPPHGILREYRVIFTSAADPQVENSIVQEALLDGNSRNVTNLLSFTEYTFQVR